MKPGEAFIHLIHSIGKCTSRAAASSLRAKDWGFVNDLTDESTSDLVQLPTVNGWKWPEVKIATDRKEMLAHFSKEGVERESFWTPDRDVAIDKKTVPYLIFFPDYVADWMAEEQRTPAEGLQFLVNEIGGENPRIREGDATLLEEWLIGAGQKGNSNDTSLLAVNMTGFLTSDRGLKSWAQRRVQRMLGGPSAPAKVTPSPQRGAQTTPNVSAADLAQIVSSALSTGMRGLAGITARQAGAAGAEAVNATKKKGTEYTEYHWARACG